MLLILKPVIPLISERYGRPLTKLLSQENKINFYFLHSNVLNLKYRTFCVLDNKTNDNKTKEVKVQSFFSLLLIFESFFQNLSGSAPTLDLTRLVLVAGLHAKGFILTILTVLLICC